jgi:hypothetical protein
MHCQKGYGFVHFAFTAGGTAAAIKCCDEMHNATVDGVTYKCSISHRLRHTLTGRHSKSQHYGAYNQIDDSQPEYTYPQMMMANPSAMQYTGGYAYNSAGMLVRVPVSLGYEVSNGQSYGQNQPHQLQMDTHTYAAQTGQHYPYLQPYAYAPQQGCTPVSSTAAAYPYAVRYPNGTYATMVPVMTLQSLQQQGGHYYYGAQAPVLQSSAGAGAYGAWYQHSPSDHGDSQDYTMDSSSGSEEYPSVAYTTQGMSAAAIASAVHGEGPYAYSTEVNENGFHVPYAETHHAQAQQQETYNAYPTYPTELPQAYTQAVANGTLPPSILGIGSHATAPEHGATVRNARAQSAGGAGMAASAASVTSNHHAQRTSGAGGVYSRTSPSKHGKHGKQAQRAVVPVVATHPPPTLLAFLPAALTATVNAAKDAAPAARAPIGVAHPHNTAEGSLVYTIRTRTKARATTFPAAIEPGQYASAEGNAGAAGSAGAQSEVVHAGGCAAGTLHASRRRPRGPEVSPTHSLSPSSVADGQNAAGATRGTSVQTPSPGASSATHEGESPYPSREGTVSVLGNEASAIDSSGLGEMFVTGEGAIAPVCSPASAQNAVPFSKLRY